MSIIYALVCFYFGYRAFRKYRERQLEPESNKDVRYFITSLLLTSIGMCGLCGFVAQLTR